MFSSSEPMAITPIPFSGLPGRIYRGSMPWTINNQDDDTFLRLKTQNIALIILLAPIGECKLAVNCNLKEVYEGQGIRVEHFPIEPGMMPEKKELGRLLEQIEGEVESGTHVLIHCMEGKRRTGLVIASLAAKALKISARDAIDMFISHVGEDVKLDKYEELIGEFSPPGVEDAPKKAASQDLPPSNKKPKDSKKGGSGCVIC